MAPLVSVIIPTYNRARFLREALASVLSQTYRPLEIIVVDDGSIDETPRLITGFPVRYVRGPHRGVAAARNRGIRLARGPFLAFLDSDDLWLPEKLARQVAFFEAHPEAVAVQPEEIWIRRGRRVNPKRRHAKEGGFIFHRCVELCVVSPSGVMLRKEVLVEVGTFDESFPACEDYDLWLRLSARYPIHLIREPLVVKRGGHADQLSRQPGLDWFRLLALQKVLYDPHLTPAMRLLARREALKKGRIFLQGALKRGKLKEAYRTHRVLYEVAWFPGLSPRLALQGRCLCRR